MTFDTETRSNTYVQGSQLYAFSPGNIRTGRSSRSPEVEVFGISFRQRTGSSAAMAPVRATDGVRECIRTIRPTEHKFMCKERNSTKL